MKDLIAICGLDCEACEARKATLEDDNALREKVAKEWTELNGVLITPDAINCEGCRVDGVKSPYCDAMCPIRQCATGKGYSTCGDCTEMESCKEVGAIIGNYSEAKKNLMA